ncbi:unnamed protein product [Fasciola hepatica]|uniref:Ubiquinol-cytochrome-c reductase complex assembly factor 2 n=1 Tax=Fasciola hepatica TaxID=6192 RepID=A0ABC9HIP8_FASHE
MIRNSSLRFICIGVFRKDRYSSNLGSRIQAFQAILDRWPADTCGRKMTFSNVIAKRIQQAIVNPSSQANQALLDQAEYDSLSRILGNHYRDKYRVPSGLGQGASDSTAPQIAATGATLLECRRILFNQEEYLKNQIPFKDRFWTMLKRLFRSDSSQLKSRP